MSDKGKIVVYEAKNGKVEIGVKLENNEIWLTQAQIAKLFNKGRSTITEHLNAVFKEGELVKDSVCRDFRHTASDGKTYDTNYYNLDAIISVGYRVNSKEGTQFRIWARGVLKDHLVNGLTINKHKVDEIEERLDIMNDNVKVFARSVAQFFIRSARQGDLNVLAEDLDKVKKDVDNIKEVINKSLNKPKKGK